ncbi:MAG: ABC transporter ATP-binding protein, partial [Phycisphaerae bacterium]
DRLLQTLWRGRRKFYREFWALRNVDLEIRRGECVGIIGRNGSGKSTLLQMIAGTLTPTEGEVQVRGRVVALLELGSGFNPDFTGRENVYLNGSILGLSAREIDQRFAAIAAFADIGDFMEQPVKTYSSGMYVRLAFAVVVNVDPDVLIVDEALAVGDMFFQSKCISHMRALLDRGVTLLFVSHDMGAIKSLCHRAIWLEHGELKDAGTASAVVDHYFAFKAAQKQDVVVTPEGKAVAVPVAAVPAHPIFAGWQGFAKRAEFQRVRNGKAAFVNIQLLNERHEEASLVAFDEEVSLCMAIEAQEDIACLESGYIIRNKDGVDLVYADSIIAEQPLRCVKAGSRHIISHRFRTPLAAGRYHICCALSIPVNSSNGQLEFCDFVPLAWHFEVTERKNGRLYGGVHLPNTIGHEDVTER